MEDRYLEPEQLADLLKISRSNLAKWRVFGGGPVFFRAGKNIRYDRIDVEAWIAERKRRTTSDRVIEPSDAT